MMVYDLAFPKPEPDKAGPSEMFAPSWQLETSIVPAWQPFEGVLKTGGPKLPQEYPTWRVTETQ